MWAVPQITLVCTFKAVLYGNLLLNYVLVKLFFHLPGNLLCFSKIVLLQWHNKCLYWLRLSNPLLSVIPYSLNSGQIYPHVKGLYLFLAHWLPTAWFLIPISFCPQSSDITVPRNQKLEQVGASNVLHFPRMLHW